MRSCVYHRHLLAPANIPEQGIKLALPTLSKKIFSIFGIG